ncbi:hypothetical protein A3B45_05240 [Candidatus Daviesbacteria bacterium RIFCSPLOWO2_01_FULL_39_12]|uniref:HTH cro/C1-type domain-containing protein n=1 Tax=Candidatus Daviesbacteria bacterium RIFCSPLOWO2_01_FULL_39_12 TaxID=1797785 RepID=A0A1F5KT15_9BACT|nr:MAG: hypothetical protein A3B45_05240 [Candidatus Daviesbacteria bacterium RIFCSPLOWO2_01_FULL_39_12]
MTTTISKDKKLMGQNLKQIRENKKMTQADVATKANITINYYARIERGEENPSFEILKGLATALKVKSSDILPF